MIKICKQCVNRFEIKDRTIAYMKSRKFCSLKCFLKSAESDEGRFKKGHTLNRKSFDPDWCGKIGLGNHGYRTKTVNGKNVLEHRYVMSVHLGRPLKKEEHVHHIDGNKLNNSISNLMLFPSNSAHLKYHWFLKKSVLSH